MAEVDQSARSRREIAELLTGRAMGRDATSIGTGLAQLGEAFLARKAIGKADSAEAEAARVRSDMINRAMGGDMSALGQLDLNAAITQKNSNRDFDFMSQQTGVENKRADEGLGLQRRGVDLQEIAQEFNQDMAGKTFDQSERQFDATMDQRGQFHGDEMGLGYAKLAADDAAARAKAQADMPNNPAGLDPDTIKLEREYAKNWQGVYDDYADISTQMGRIKAMGDPNIPDDQRAVADLALVVAFTKMLDPGSVAREGEVALTQSAASLIGQAETWLPKLKNGKTLLPDETRNALVAAASSMMPIYDEAYNRLGQNYTSTAQQYGFEPERVMMGWTSPESRAPGPTGPPQPGAVEDGFEFMGGDPTDEKNWKPVGGAPPMLAPNPHWAVGGDTPAGFR